VFVIFGASSDIGRRVTRYLLDAGHRPRVVASKPCDLDRRAERVVGTILNANEITRDAEVVISCAHARHTSQLLPNLGRRVRQVVLVGSAWRYSLLKNAKADEVRAGEAAFLESNCCGVMLHPTMIYGGTQEKNIQQLLKAICRWPVVLLPGGGKHLVQPIYVDDVAKCVVAAAQKRWNYSAVIPIAGPEAIRWRKMVEVLMKETGCRRVVVPVPLSPLIGFLRLLACMGISAPFDPDILRRFREDVNISVEKMQIELGVKPRAFEMGLREALGQWGAIMDPNIGA
jgi:nucleoside-diphosphate-sugar epimerase